MSAIVDNILRLLDYDPAAPMIFSSGLFWAIFLVFIPVYAMLKRRHTMMIVFVIVFSLYFYYKSSGWFCLLLLATSLIDWSLSHAIAGSGGRRTRVCLTALSITLSLSVLGYFKYANFFLWNWNVMVQGNFQPLDIVLPVGISFYTFQSISYVVDVYKRRVAPTRRWIDYLFFLSFFPALVAGPIVRAEYFLPQIPKNHRATSAEVYWGFWLIILGVLKKAVVADYISQYNDLIFSSPGGYSGFESLMGVVGYTMQIYCDFSGYSDMAIGIAMIMGFHLSKNFDFPYKSQNLSEFWRRWHISLSSWLRDYVYIPLGGNRRGTARTYINNFLTMLIGGLWHGAAWKFVFWGAMHGVGLAVHKATAPVVAKVPDNRVTKTLWWTVTMVYVSLLWTFFRASSWTDSVLIIENIFSNFSADYILPFLSVRWMWAVMMVVVIAVHAMPSGMVDAAGRWFVRTNWLVKLLIFIVVVQLVIQFKGEDVAPFIYFQF